MTGTQSFKLPIPVETPADVGFVLNELAGGSILSIAQLADSGHSTIALLLMMMILTA